MKYYAAIVTINIHYTIIFNKYKKTVVYTHVNGE